MRLKNKLAIILLLLLTFYNVPTSALDAESEYRLKLTDEIGKGLCYPFLFTQHTAIDLRTGEETPVMPSDTIQTVYCSDTSAVLIGNTTITIFDTEKAKITAVLQLFTNKVIAFTGNYLVIASQNLTDFSFIETKSGTALPIKPLYRPALATATEVDGKPVLFYATLIGDKYYYFVSYAGKELRVKTSDTLEPIGAYKNKLLIATDYGVEVYGISKYGYQPTRETVIPVESTITSFIGVYRSYTVWNTLLGAMLLDVEKREVRLIGASEITTGGFYNPLIGQGYTLLDDNTLYAVAGRPLGQIGNVVLYSDTSGTYIAFSKATNFIYLAKTTTATLIPQGADKMLVITLTAGAQKLPFGATLIINDKSIVLDKAEMEYPPSETTQLTPREIELKTYAITFPKFYVPALKIENVTGVYSGGGDAIVLTQTKAYIVTDYGIAFEKEGSYIMGGGSKDCIVLYDGLAFHVYDKAGNKLATITFTVPAGIRYLTCSIEKEKPVITLLSGSNLFKITSDNYTVQEIESLKFGEKGGLKYEGLFLTYGAYKLAVPTSEVRISGLMASWRYNMTYHVLDLASHTLYSLVNTPDDIEIVPTRNSYVVIYKDGTAELVSLYSWLVRKCSVEIITSPPANVTINGNHVGEGNVTAFTECGKLLKITATRNYYNTAKEEIAVWGKEKVFLTLTPKIANVTLNVILPQGLKIDNFTVTINGKTMTWGQNETRELVAGKEYTITLIDPLRLCSPIQVKKVFHEGNNTLTLKCDLRSSVIVAYSKIDTIVRISKKGRREKGEKLYYVPANGTKLMPIDAGDYVLISVPKDKENYTNTTIELTVPEKTVVKLDVTPTPLSKLILRVTPSLANVSIYDPEGKLVFTELATGEEIEVKLTPSNYTLKVTASGYLPHVEQFTVRGGEVIQKNITLKLRPVQTTTKEKPIWSSLIFRVLALILAILLGILIYKLRRIKAEREELEEEEVSEEETGEEEPERIITSEEENEEEEGSE